MKTKTKVKVSLRSALSPTSTLDVTDSTRTSQFLVIKGKAKKITLLLCV